MQSELKQSKEDKYIEELKEHIKCCEDSMKYSLDRFDILIITLSSGALGFSLSFIKEATKNQFNHLFFLRYSWILFGVALISNILSQVTSYFAHVYEMKISKSLIRKEKGKDPIKNELKYESLKKIFDSLTKWMNGVSLISLIIGVAFLIIFTYSNF